jgi:hypothetical protein
MGLPSSVGPAVGFGHDCVFGNSRTCIDFCYDAIAVSVICCLLMTYLCGLKSRTTTREIAAELIKRLFAEGLSAQRLSVAPAPSQGVETADALCILLMTHGKPARSQRLLI